MLWFEIIFSIFFRRFFSDHPLICYKLVFTHIFTISRVELSSVLLLCVSYVIFMNQYEFWSVLFGSATECPWYTVGPESRTISDRLDFFEKQSQTQVENGRNNPHYVNGDWIPKYSHQCWWYKITIYCFRWRLLELPSYILTPFSLRWYFLVVTSIAYKLH